MGGLFSTEAGMIIGELKQQGMVREQRAKDASYISAIEKLNENYGVALELDNGSLLLGDFRLINSVVTSADVRAKSLRKMIQLWDEGKRFEDLGNDPVIDFDYKAYSQIITAYVDEKRYDEALSVINEIEEKFPSMQSEIDLGRQRITGFLQNEKAEVVQQQKTTEPAEPKKTEPVAAEVKPPVVKVEEAQQKNEDIQEANNNKALIIGVVIAVLLLVGFVAVRRKKK